MPTKKNVAYLSPQRPEHHPQKPIIGFMEA
jgi:hypothetical protein